MSFSYDLTTTVGQMRLELGDNSLEAGILPDGANFTDAELAYFYEAEGEFWPAVARAFDAAAARWGMYPTQISMGPESQSLPAAAFYSQKAQDIRTKQRRPSSVTLTKADYGFEVD
jgi:hypothetical protein